MENYKAKVSVCVDDVNNIQDMAHVLTTKGDDVEIGIIVEVNVSSLRFEWLCFDMPAFSNCFHLRMTCIQSRCLHVSVVT